MKRRVNLTLDQRIYKAAHYVATARERSLSDMVEYHLRRMVDHMARHGEAADTTPEEHWLDRYYREHLPGGDVASGDNEINDLKRERLRPRDTETAG